MNCDCDKHDGTGVKLPATIPRQSLTQVANYTTEWRDAHMNLPKIGLLDS